MNNGLEIFNLYAHASDSQIEEFSDRVDSQLHINKKENKLDCNYEWLEVIEQTIPYIDNILRNPNRFIINEEDVVKIELAKRVTVDSIKHLARNTNLIQDIDDKTGDVKPAKILNINKEESFNTYENRFIFTLVQNMMTFVDFKKKGIVEEAKYDCNNDVTYNGKCTLGDEKVNIELKLNNSIRTRNRITDAEGNDLATKINKVEQRIKDLTRTELYKSIKMLHIALVTSPIKKTNIILQNVNFQYAVKLWNYIQEHINDEGSVESNKDESYDDTGTIKNYFDESFLLDYLVSQVIIKGEAIKLDKDILSERLIGNVVEKIIDINENISEEQLANLVAKQYTIIKYRSVVTDKKIKKIYRAAIDKYLKKVSDLDME
jgi:hypothetical protein